MENNSLLALNRARETALIHELEKCNDLSERYGLSLSAAQMRTLLNARANALADTGRLELGESILPRLIYAFCDSPYIARDDYCETLSSLLTLFYAFKSDLETALSDDELIEAMRVLFNGRAQGSLEYMENVTVGELYRAANGLPEDGDEDDE